MSSAIRLGALAMAAVMVLAVATPAVATEPADIEFSAGNTSFTVTVTHNGTPVNDTVVNVTPTDPANVSYSGSSGLTDANGTITFDLPENETEVRISTTYNGTESSTTKVLPARGSEEPGWDGQGPFGQWVSNLLRGLGVDSGTSLGQQLSELVVKNNPGSEQRSDKANPGGNGAGPPEHAVNKSADKGNNSNGPPDHAVNKSDDEGNDSNGPPDHAKNDSEKSGNNTASGNETAGNNGNSGQGNGNGNNGNNGQGNGNGENGNNGQGNGNGGNGNNGQGNGQSLARTAF